LIRTYLDFEKPIAELESKVAELKALAGEQHSVSIEEELARLERKAREALEETYSELTPWQKTQVARHPERPHFRHYVEALVEDFTPLAGDRFFAEDQAIVGGMAGSRRPWSRSREGLTPKAHSNCRPAPKAVRRRLMEMADASSFVVSLVDTAEPSRHRAEERGQGEAIARSTDCCLGLGVLIVAVVIGEGGQRRRHRYCQPGHMLGTRSRRVARSRGLDSLARLDARDGRRDQHENHRPGPFEARRHRRDHRRAGRRGAPGRD
jgi:acetyl-CoA carboxylase carboxyl transferase subunit alpha